MNILFLSTHLNTGGISSYLYTLGEALAAQGHRIFIGSSGGNLVENFQESGIQHIALNIRTKSELSPRIYIAGHHLKSFIRNEQIDVIHANTRITQVMGELLFKTTPCAYVSTCHGFFKPKWFRRVFPAWGQLVIAISNPVRDHLIRDLGVKTEKVVLIRNGLNAEKFPLVSADAKKALRREFHLGDEPVVGIIARLSDVKGHHILIEAMHKVLKEIPQAKLLIIGEGPRENFLKGKVAGLALEKNILFYPVVNQTSRMLQLLDCFVLPSLQEGLGLSAMEAQASGLPVVASKVGGIPDLIKDGETGLLVPPGNVHILAESILLLLRQRPQAEAMGKKARELIRTEFSSQKMAEQTLEVYKKALELKHA